MANLAFSAPQILSLSRPSSSTRSACSTFVKPMPRPVASVPRQTSSASIVASAGSLSGKRVLVIGGTRFSGLYLVHELANRGAEVVILNRGSKNIGDESLKVPGETDEHFAERNSRTTSLIGDRCDAAALKELLSKESFDVIYDNNGRKVEDSIPVIDYAKGSGSHFIYMSSAGVYMKSQVMPHIEGDEVDQKSRHKGKLDTEQYMQEQGITYTSIRPTYIYGALNYNPLEQWFFERLDKNLPICVPGHGTHLTGLGHVRDLASAMAACAVNPTAYGQVYNVQDTTAVTFDGVAKLCAKAMGKDEPEIIHYDPKSVDLGKLKAFPFRPQHFFCSPTKALSELEWSIEYNLEKGLKDSYTNDFVIKKAAGGLKNDFTADNIIINSIKGAVV